MLHPKKHTLFKLKCIRCITHSPYVCGTLLTQRYVWMILYLTSCISITFDMNRIFRNHYEMFACINDAWIFPLGAYML